jgi:hypothetical protein
MFDARPIQRILRRSNFSARATIALIAINGLWRTVRYSLAFPIWGDEAFVIVNLLRRDFIGLFSPLEYGQILPLGFIWAEYAATQLAGTSEWALRLVPYILGLTSMLFFHRFVRQFVDRRTALLAVAVFAASYYPVRHATEVKPYAADLLLSMILMHLGWAIHQSPDSMRRWITLSVVAALSLWFSYTAVFVAAGVSLLLMVDLARRRTAQTITRCLALNASIALSFALLFIFYARPHALAIWVPGATTTVETWGGGFPFAKGLAYFPIWFLKTHTGNMLAYPVGGRDGGSTFTFFMVLIATVTLYRTRRDLLLLLLSPLPFVFAAAVLQRYPYGYSARLSLYMAPPFCLMFAIGIMTLFKTLVPRRHVPGAIIITATVMACIAVGGIVADLLEPYKTFSDQENRRVMRDLATRTQPNDQWVSFNAPDPELTYADNIYLRGGSGARYRYYLHQLAPVTILWAPKPDEIPLPQGGRTWLIVFRDDRAPFPEDALKDYLQTIARRHGRPEREEFSLEHGRYDMKLEIYKFPENPAPPL